MRHSTYSSLSCLPFAKPDRPKDQDRKTLPQDPALRPDIDTGHVDCPDQPKARLDLRPSAVPSRHVAVTGCCQRSGATRSNISDHASDLAEAGGFEPPVTLVTLSRSPGWAVRGSSGGSRVRTCLSAFDG